MFIVIGDRQLSYQGQIREVSIENNVAQEDITRNGEVAANPEHELLLKFSLY
jgi:hypothetical protein